MSRLDLNEQCIESFREYLSTARLTNASAEDSSHFGCPMGMSNKEAPEYFRKLDRESKKGMLKRIQETTQAMKELQLA